MHDALYGADGFYSTGRGQPGRRGDFITSPEVGPLFGMVIGRALDKWWREMGEPDPFTVYEVGAGTGALGRSVARANLACAGALHYAMVEIGPYAPPEAVTALPDGVLTGVILCNELLDNLPIDLAFDGRLLAAHEPWPLVGLYPVQSAATAFVSAAVANLARGRVVAIDYCGTAFAHRPWEQWLRTYRAHAPGGHPTADPGRQDITCEVDISQLPIPSVNRSQGEFLDAYGINELVAEGRAIWHERAHLGDLAAMKARSRITEAEALCDPTGLGAFRVLEWVVG